MGFLLYPCINPFLCGFLCLLSAAACMIIIPYNRTIVGLIITLVANGVSLGMIDGSKYTRVYKQFRPILFVSW